MTKKPAPKKNGKGVVRKIISVLLVLFLIVGCLYIRAMFQVSTSPDQPDAPSDNAPGPSKPDPDHGGPSKTDGSSKGGDSPKPDGSRDDKHTRSLSEDGSYYSKNDVALYIYTYGKLPQNFITKKEAEKLGWEGGSVEKVAPGKAIGGDTFSNYEKVLPTGHKYTECDIDTKGQKSRGAKRIIFSDDGLIYYTDDHYETFELLYGDE